MRWVKSRQLTGRLVVEIPIKATTGWNKTTARASNVRLHKLALQRLVTESLLIMTRAFLLASGFEDKLR